MSHTIINGNGHHTPIRSEDVLSGERRLDTPRRPLSPEQLLARQIDAARRQLADAREDLKQGRMRVVELEEAVSNWESFAQDLRRAQGVS
jgi:hypothetical protein